jgi:sec-independent protein translocase protein TatB
MLDFNAPEFLVVAIVALLVIGPKDLPKALRVVGKWVGRARGVARQFRSGFDTMIRESELADMEKQWAAENERIMREHPPAPAIAAPMPMAIEGGAEAEPVMVAQPAIRPEIEDFGTAMPPAETDAAPSVDVAEAKPAPKPRKPRAKALS